jgi:hypothetical protein
MLKPKVKKSKKQGLYFDFHEVIYYIDFKYNISHRDLNNTLFERIHTGNKTLEKQNFWHWLIDMYDFKRASFCEVQLLTKVTPILADGKYPVWAQEQLKRISDEFQLEGGKIKFWLDW